MDRTEQKTATISGALLLIFGLILHVLANRAEPDISSHFVMQAGNLSLIGAIISFIAAFHANLTRLAAQEKLEADSQQEGGRKLFENEVDDAGTASVKWTTTRVWGTLKNAQLGSIVAEVCTPALRTKLLVSMS